MRTVKPGSILLLTLALCMSAEGQTLRIKTLSKTTSFGGQGGSEYENSCPFGSVMTGINYREGSWVDAVGPICSRFDRDKKHFVEGGALPLVGGHGGGPGAIRCERQRGVVIGFAVTQARNRDKSVGSIFVVCGDYLSP